jgi:hypothetical protein
MSTTNADDPSITTRNTPQKSFKQRRSFGKRVSLPKSSVRGKRELLTRVCVLMKFANISTMSAVFTLFFLLSNTASRKDEVASIRSKFPQKVPVCYEGGSALSLAMILSFVAML